MSAIGRYFLLVALFSVFTDAAHALTELLKDTEPNDKISEANILTSPGQKDSVRIIGDLDGQDQDAYYWVVDEEDAGVRWNIRLEGHPGALTRLDIMDLTEFVEGSSQSSLIGLKLERKPPILATLGVRDAGRPAFEQDFLLRPGNYVLAVSHSGGAGQYTIELSQAGADSVKFVKDDNSAEKPLELRYRSGFTVMAQADVFFSFTLDEKTATNQTGITFQTPLGVPADAILFDSNGVELLRVQGEGGQPLRRSGLQLAAGKYRIKTHTGELAVQRVLVDAGTVASAGTEVEPNDGGEFANKVIPGETIKGQIGSSDNADWIGFTIDKENANKVWNIIATPSDISVQLRLCLKRQDLLIDQCRYKNASEPAVSLSHLNLPPGDYLLLLDPRGGKTDWAITWEDLGVAESGVEVEPNDTYQTAVAFPDKPAAKGHFNGKETDFWRFTVAGEPQLWRAQLQGEDVFELYIKNNYGDTIQSVRGSNSNRIRLESLFLVPGEYFLAASGTDSDYTLLLRPLGPPDPDAELEPNDDLQNALPLAFGQQRNGFMPDKADNDRFQFALAGPEHIKLKAKSPADGAIYGSLNIGDDNQKVSSIYPRPEAGLELVWDAWLPAGDYNVVLESSILSDAEYQISLERLPWFDGSVDREPNNDEDHAFQVRPDGLIFGEVGISRVQTDWYRLPYIETVSDIAIPFTKGLSFELFAERNFKDNILTRDNENKQFTAALQPGGNYSLKISGAGKYALNLFAPPASPDATPDDTAPNDTLAEKPAPRPAVSAVKAVIQFDDPPVVQSFSSWEQLVKGRLLLSNAGNEAQVVDLEVVLSDSRWRFEGGVDQFQIAAGASLEQAFTLAIPPDALPDRNVRVNIRLVDGKGQESYAMGEVTTDPDVLPGNPRYAWFIPQSLRGGINVAASSNGGKLVESPGVAPQKLKKIAPLIDGLTQYGRWTEVALGSAGQGTGDFQQPTIELAGSLPIPVAGFLIDPTSNLSTGNFLSEFEVALSVDGTQYETVYRGQLKPLPMEQAFVLDASVEARYARLIPLSSAQGSAKRTNVIRLGEFKVVAVPGFVPDNLQKRNLMAQEHGGHLVWSEPWLNRSGYDVELLATDDKAPAIRLKAGDTATVTLGLHHSRAARVASIGFVKKAGVADKSDVTRVEVAASSTTPFGPFEPIGEWPLGQLESEVTLDQPVWARYLRFRFYATDDARDLTLPDQIAVWEAASTDTYRSILAEWGRYSNSGPLEAADEPTFLGPRERGINDTREKALALTNGKAVPGVALLDDYDAWYRVDVPGDQNTINLTMRGAPTLMAQSELLNAAGEMIPLYEQDSVPSEMIWQAFVEPGQSYWLRAYEPPRALIFSWDTSASVGWYMPSMRNALYRYAENIKPDSDVVNLLPFGLSKPLLRDWQGEPYALKLMLNSYPMETSSSEAERALAAASRAMQGRPGKKGVILLTDASTSTDADLWPALREGRPMVFALGVSSEGAFGPSPYIEQDLMQEWSRVNGGEYQYITSLGALQQGYGRAISRMRQPVTFEVQTDVSFTEDPGPASLRLVSGEALTDPGARGAVELILDASGSMLKRMGGQRRIEIAKAAIANVVENVLPEGMPLALRVYGHKEAGSCRTDLEQKLAPLNKASLLAKLDSVNAINLAKTPIADSLAQVGNDMADAKGRRWVILLTDGEETCGGDPTAVLEKLAADGVDVRLNIVGFAIDDEALKAEFGEWARLGGGSYFDAGEAQALNQAMEQSLQIPFRVINQAGEQVAAGVLDGDPIELPPGSYMVELDTEPVQRFRDVKLAPGDALELAAGG